MILTAAEVLEKTVFLNECLVPRKKFLHASREKAWGKYHHAYLRQLPSVMELRKSARAAAWLCLRSFEKMLDVNYPLSAQPEAEQSQSQLSEQNKDIVHFIGGSVLQKLKQRLTRQKDCTAKEEKLQCIDNMLEKEGSDEASLTSTLNTGDCFS